MTVTEADRKFFEEVFSLDKEKQALVKGFVAGLQVTAPECRSCGKDPPRSRKM